MIDDRLGIASLAAALKYFGAKLFAAVIITAIIVLCIEANMP